MARAAIGGPGRYLGVPAEVSMRPTTQTLLPTATGVALLALLAGFPLMGSTKASELPAVAGQSSAPAPVPAPTTAAAPAPAASPLAAAAAVTPEAAAPPTKASLKAAAKAEASYRRTAAAYGAQMALVSPTNGGLRLAAGGPGMSLGLHAAWTLPKGLRLRPRLDYTVFSRETRTTAAAPLPQTLNTKVSSLALGADFLMPLGSGWSAGLTLAETRWSVASSNTVTSTLGGSMTVSGTSHWGRLAVGPVLTFQVSDHLEFEGRALSSHYGYQNQPATTAAVGLLWRF